MRKGVWPFGDGRAWGEAVNQPSFRGACLLLLPLFPVVRLDARRPSPGTSLVLSLCFPRKSSSGWGLAVSSPGPGRCGLLPLQGGWEGAGARPTPQRAFGSLISSSQPGPCGRPCSHYPLRHHRVGQRTLHPPACWGWGVRVREPTGPQSVQVGVAIWEEQTGQHHLSLRTHPSLRSTTASGAPFLLLW